MLQTGGGPPDVPNEDPVDDLFRAVVPTISYEIENCGIVWPFLKMKVPILVNNFDFSLKCIILVLKEKHRGRVKTHYCQIIKKVVFFYIHYMYTHYSLCKRCHFFTSNGKRKCNRYKCSKPPWNNQ